MQVKLSREEWKKINISKFQFDRMQDLRENHFRVSGASWVNITNYYYYYLLY